MTIGVAPLCAICKHLDEEADGFVCAAFPQGIPEGIIYSRLDHRQPVTGDNGVQFEPRAGVQADQVKRHVIMLGLD